MTGKLNPGSVPSIIETEMDHIKKRRRRSINNRNRDPSEWKTPEAFHQ
jgi:hypothetical protein